MEATARMVLVVEGMSLVGAISISGTDVGSYTGDYVATLLPAFM